MYWRGCRCVCLCVRGGALEGLSCPRLSGPRGLFAAGQGNRAG